MNSKKTAALKALEFVKDGMSIGLGTGSTVTFFIEGLAEEVKNGLSVKCVSTSKQSKDHAESLGLKIFELDDFEFIDLTVDGADEVDRNLNGIKGGGGALLIEKIVASNSRLNIWIVDESKIVEKLGSFPLPVEVIPFGSKSLMKRFDYEGFNPVLRLKENKTFFTDSGNYIIDLHLNKIDEPESTEKYLNLLPGVVECGLFLGIADKVIVGSNNSVRIIERKN